MSKNQYQHFEGIVLLIILTCSFCVCVCVSSYFKTGCLWSLGPIWEFLFPLQSLWVLSFSLSLSACVFAACVRRNVGKDDSAKVGNLHLISSTIYRAFSLQHLDKKLHTVNGSVPFIETVLGKPTRTIATLLYLTCHLNIISKTFDYCAVSSKNDCCEKAHSSHCSAVQCLLSVQLFSLQL